MINIKPLTLLLWSITIAFSALIIWSSNRGLDITDDSFYLLNIIHPKQNIGSVTEFGKYLNISYFESSNSIANLRLLNFFVTLFCFLILSWNFANILFFQDEFRIVYFLTILFSSFAIYSWWLITPSYNTFVVIGSMLIALATLKIIYPELRPKSLLYCGVLIGIGGFLTAIGRPTSALAAGAIAGIWIILMTPLRRGLGIGVVAASIFLALVALHVLTLGGGVIAMLERLNVARELAATLNAGHTLHSAFDRLISGVTSVPDQLVVLPTVLGIAVAIATYVALVLLGHERDFRLACAAFSGSTLVVLSTLYYTSSQQIALVLGYIGIRLFLFLMLANTVSIFLQNKFSHIDARHSQTIGIKLSNLSIATFFAALALILPFGGSGELVRSSSIHYGLYSVSLILLFKNILHPQSIAIQSGFILVIVAPVAFVLQDAARHPYRLPESIFKQTEQIELLDQQSTLLVDGQTARWAKGLEEAALAHGWSPGLPLFDLTGGTPGAALILGAQPPVTTWIVGGYEGSNAYAKSILAQTPKADLDRAWILTAPSGTRRIDESVLEEVGISFPADYSLVAEVTSGHRNEKQLLWKPHKAETR